jgi:tetratricopeptide (TPR) repeat protein
MNFKISASLRLCVRIIWFPCSCFLIVACSIYADTDYAKETAGLQQKIAQLGEPATKDDAIKLIYYRYQLAALSGDYNDFKAVEDSIDRALQTRGPADDIYYFRAQLNFKLHRLQAALDALASMPLAMDSTSLRALRADIALQQGHYAEALRGYEAIAAEKSDWDALARLAYYRLKTGRPEDADELYRQAADMIPASEMRSYAWVELQRGLLDLEYGRYQQALEHYQIADRAYSGYWLTEEHIAEVLQLSGRSAAAAKLYRKIIERTRNPQILTALANTVAATNPGEAAALYREADALYESQLALYPDAAAGHLIEYLLQKKEIDPRLQEYARRNHVLRPNAEAKLLLAKASLKLGAPEAAHALILEILKTPWRTPELAVLAANTGMDDTGKNLSD